jgi:hypothetical protein
MLVHTTGVHNFVLLSFLKVVLKKKNVASVVISCVVRFKIGLSALIQVILWGFVLEWNLCSETSEEHCSVVCWGCYNLVDLKIQNLRLCDMAQPGKAEDITKHV